MIKGGCCSNAFYLAELYLGLGTKVPKMVSADKVIGVRSSWQSEKLASQRKESSGHKNSFFSLCPSREIGGERTRGAGKPVIK